MGLSCPLEVSRCVPAEAKFFGIIFWPYNKSFIDLVSTLSRSIKTQNKNSANIQPLTSRLVNNVYILTVDAPFAYLVNSFLKLVEQFPHLFASCNVVRVVKEQLLQLGDKILLDFHHKCSLSFTRLRYFAIGQRFELLFYLRPEFSDNAMHPSMLIPRVGGGGRGGATQGILTVLDTLKVGNFRCTIIWMPQKQLLKGRDFEIH